MIKNEKGSVTLLVAVTVLFIIIILSSSLMLVSLKRKSQLQESKILQEIYGGDNLNEIYQEQLEKKDYSNLGSTSISASEVTSDLYGKYIDIGLDINNNDKTTDDWEIFYAGNGRIFLIAADYVLTEKLEEWNVIGDGTTLGNNGFKKYGGSHKYILCWPSNPASFLTLPTEPTNFSELVMCNGYSLSDHQSNYNSMAASHLLNKESWNGIKTASKKSDYIDFVIGGPTIEMWCAAWNEAIKGDENGFAEIKAEGTSGYGYCLSSDTSKNQYRLYMNGTQTNCSNNQLQKLGTTYKTFFPHMSTYEGCNGYWLASPSASDIDSLLIVHCYDHLSCTLSVSGSAYPVRPVVCLKSETNIEWNSEKEMFDLISKE